MNKITRAIAVATIAASATTAQAFWGPGNAPGERFGVADPNAKLTDHGRTHGYGHLHHRPYGYGSSPGSPYTYGVFAPAVALSDEERQAFEERRAALIEQQKAFAEQQKIFADRQLEMQKHAAQAYQEAIEAYQRQGNTYPPVAFHPLTDIHERMIAEHSRALQQMRQRTSEFYERQREVRQKADAHWAQTMETSRARRFGLFDVRRGLAEPRKRTEEGPAAGMDRTL